MDVDLQPKHICRLLKLHLDDIYPILDIGYHDIRRSTWNIEQIVNERELIIDPKLIDPSVESIQKETYDIVNRKIMAIFDPRHLLYRFMYKWTDTNKKRWKIAEDNSYLRKILRIHCLEGIDPIYVTSIYVAAYQLHGRDLENIDAFVNHHIGKCLTERDMIIEKAEFEIRSLLAHYHRVDSTASNIGDKSLQLFNGLTMIICDKIRRLTEIHILNHTHVLYPLLCRYIYMDEIEHIISIKNTGKILVV